LGIVGGWLAGNFGHGLLCNSAEQGIDTGWRIQTCRLPRRRQEISSATRTKVFAGKDMGCSKINLPTSKVASTVAVILKN